MGTEAYVSGIQESKRQNAPLTVNFSAACSSDPDDTLAAYAWTFGDGATSTAANPSHTYLNRGIYTARLTVTDNLGASASASVVITVRRPPQLANPRVAIPGTVTFNLEGETSVNYTLQAASDSRTWTNILTLPTRDLPAQLTLPVGTTNPVLFWRAVMQ